MKHILRLTAVVLSLGCDGINCTLIGCDSFLRVEIRNAPAGAITIQGTAVGSPGISRTTSCPGPGSCTITVQLVGFTPARAQLSVTTAGGTRQWDVRPTYTTSQPNGSECGPTCQQGDVTLAWQ
jgi:hypothetical protein